ncbi:hypothetical protein PAAL109150_23840 [Paenibacillus alkaliterrae]
MPHDEIVPRQHSVHRLGRRLFGHEIFPPAVQAQDRVDARAIPHRLTCESSSGRFSRIRLRTLLSRNHYPPLRTIRSAMRKQLFLPIWKNRLCLTTAKTAIAKSMELIGIRETSLNGVYPLSVYAVLLRFIWLVLCLSQQGKYSASAESSCRVPENNPYAAAGCRQHSARQFPVDIRDYASMCTADDSLHPLS